MISDNCTFSIKMKEILTETGWVRSGYDYPSTASATLAGWKGLIAECRKGYPYNIYEYDNDLTIRAMIEFLLSLETLKEYPEYREFSEEVKSLDVWFSEMLQKDVRRSDLLSSKIKVDYPEFHKRSEEAESPDVKASKT